MNSLTPRLLDVRSAAAYLGVSANTIRNWLSDEILKPVRLPGSTLRDRKGKIVARPSDRQMAKVFLDRNDLDSFIDHLKQDERGDHA